MKEEFNFKLETSKVDFGRINFQMKIESDIKVLDENQNKLTELGEYIVKKLLEEPNKVLNILVSV